MMYGLPLPLAAATKRIVTIMRLVSITELRGKRVKIIQSDLSCAVKWLKSAVCIDLHNVTAPLVLKSADEF